jgi:pimeloyl-ACP methyl ester carboxylesterase
MSNPTLLLIPGLLCDASVWAPVQALLNNAAHIADLSTQDNLTTMAEDLLAAHPGRLRIAGHSMGARVAMEMARLAPDRVERMVLLDTGIHPLRAGETEKRAEIVAFAHANGMAALADRWLPGMVHRQDPALMQSLRAMVLRMTPDLHERQIRALVTRPDAAAYLPDLHCSTLLIVGAEDQWSPVAQHQDMLALLPDARLIVIPDAGHFAPLENPDPVAQATAAFLTKDAQ